VISIVPINIGLLLGKGVVGRDERVVSA